MGEREALWGSRLGLGFSVIGDGLFFFGFVFSIEFVYAVGFRFRGERVIRVFCRQNPFVSKEEIFYSEVY